MPVTAREGIIRMIGIGLTVVAVFSVGLGVILMRVPKRVIEGQITFYRWINWRMEPVSWEKEIRNTRIMGVIALVAGIGTLLLRVTCLAGL